MSAITRKTHSTIAAVRSFTVDAIGFDTAVVCTVCTFVNIYRWKEKLFDETVCVHNPLSQTVTTLWVVSDNFSPWHKKLSCIACVPPLPTPIPSGKIGEREGGLYTGQSNLGRPLSSSCAAFSQSLSLNSLQWRIRGELTFSNLNEPHVELFMNVTH